MGKIDQEFLNYIIDVYPEFESLKLELHDKSIVFSEVNYLLPYLAFTNSLDDENRLINVFHPPFSDHHKIIPFYITLAVFKKEVDKMRGTLQPIENDLIVLHNGNKCKLMNIDLENQRIRFRLSTSTGYMSFDEFKSPLVRPYSRKQRDKFNQVKELVEEYQLIHSNTIKKLLDTPKYVNSGYESGVILFTNKGKFKTLFNSLKVAGLSINSRIPAVDAVYDKSNQKYRYDEIYSGGYSELSRANPVRPFILVASYLDVEQIDTFRKKYSHLDTIIFDEAEKRFNDIEKVIREIKKGLNSNSEGSLRDVYLLTSDSSLHTYYDLNKWEGNLPFHWISTPKDMSTGENKGHNVHLVENGSQSHLLEKLESLRMRVVKLFKLINYEEIKPFYDSLKELIIRYYSFYDVEKFRSSVKDLKADFEEFSKKNLDKEFDEQIINNFKALSEQLLNDNPCLKLQYLKRQIEEIGLEDAELIGVVSRNENANDQRIVKEWLSKFDVNVEFLDFDEPIKSVKDKNFDILLFFEIRKPYINSLFIHDFPSRVCLLLTEYEYSNFYRKNFFRVTSILNRITAKEKRGELLNIDQDIREIFFHSEDLYKSNIDEFVVNKELINKSQDFEEGAFTEEEKDLLYNKSENEIESLIIQSIQNRTDTYDGVPNGRGKAVNRDDNILIIFEDKTLQKVGPNKKYYKVTDEDVANIDDLVIQADQISKGDDLLLFHIDHDDLLDLLLNKIKVSDQFKPIYILSEKWRDNVIALCDEVGYERAAELLSEYIDRKPITLENWYKGITFAPNQHKKVIKGLNKIAAQHDFEKMEYLTEVDSIKEASSKIKGLLLSLPRKLKERSVRKLYDLNNEKEDSNEAVLIDQILNDVDIKTVSYIVKN